MTISMDNLTAVVAVCRAQTLTVRSPNSCIASTRILTEVLNYFGHASEPLASTTLVLNAEAHELAQQDVPTEQWPATAHSVGILGTGGVGVVNPNGWDGHLVAIVDGQWLADPSLDQLARPSKGIHVGPCVLDVRSWSDRSKMCHWRRGDGTVIAYQQMTNPGPWRQAPDWSKNLPLYRPAIAAAIRTLKGTIQ